MTEINQKQFTGFFIPRDIVQLWEQHVLNQGEMILLSVVDSLVKNSEKGCFASNEFLADKMKESVTSVRRKLCRLRRLGLIKNGKFDGRIRQMFTCYSTLQIGESDQIWSGRVTKYGQAHILSPLEGYNTLENTVANSDLRLIKKDFLKTKKDNSPNIIFTKLTKKLYNALSKKRKIQRKPDLQKWTDEFEHLHIKDNVSIKSINFALDWYCLHIGEKYIVGAYSAKSFRQKFDNIFNRAKENSQNNESSISSEAKMLTKVIWELGWPKITKDSLEKSIDSSLKFYSQFYEDLKSTCRKSKSVVKKHRKKTGTISTHTKVFKINEFSTLLLQRLDEPNDFLEKWYNAIFQKIKDWNDWSGSFRSYTINFNHVDFQDMIKKINRDWSMDESHWKILADYLKGRNENY